MTSGTGSLDVLVKEYLIFRGFIQSAKQLDLELRADKDKGFRAELVVDRIISYITSYDLQNLRDFWTYLDTRVFSRLEQSYHASTRRLYFSVLKYYVVHATTNNRPDKVTDFFTKMSAELQTYPEWKDWFALPFVKHPESNDVFSTCFSKQWQDALQLSLFNYLSVVFQSMPAPSLMDIQRRLAGNSRVEGEKKKPMLRGSMDMVDDFYTLTQTIPVEDPNVAKQKGKSIVSKSLAKVKAAAPNPAGKAKVKPAAAPVGVASTLLAGASQALDSIKGLPATASNLTGAGGGRLRRPHSVDHNEMRQALLAPTATRPLSTGSNVTGADAAASDLKEQEMTSLAGKGYGFSDDSQDFMVSGQHVYQEHNSAITHATFSRSGHLIASADVDKVVKLWTREAVPTTISTIISKSNVLSLQFVDSTDRHLLLASKPDAVKVYDIASKKSVSDMNVAPGLSGVKISDMDVETSAHNFVCSALINGTASGLLSIWNMHTTSKHLSLETSPIQSVMYFNQGANVLAGCVDGSLKIYDINQGKMVKEWNAHSGKVYTIQMSHDGQSCFTMDSDNTVSHWNLSSGKLVQSFTLHDGAAGPYVYQLSIMQKTIQTPKDRIFSLNSTNSHFLTCFNNAGLIYKIVDGNVKRSMTLGGHTAPVAAVDWVATDTDTCLTADMSGVVRLSTLL